MGSERVLKKINFKLRQKGLEMDDWPRCLHYHQELSVQHLLEAGKVLELGLDRE